MVKNMYFFFPLFLFLGFFCSLGRGDSQAEALFPPEIAECAIQLGLPLRLGVSPQILEVQRLIKLYGPLNAPVLILGETGVGKSLVAEMLALFNPRKKYHPVNIGALHKHLFEAELFGAKKGSYTGSHQDRDGHLKLADGSTLFLDEIDSLPLDLQVKMLTAVEKRTFTPVGVGKEETSDFRLVAASNADLQRKVARNRFRADLFYRLNSLVIEIPPLRKRPADIEFLAKGLISKLALENNLSEKPMSDEAIKKLLAYAWPGNIRQLSAVLLVALLHAQGSAAIQTSMIKLPAAETGASYAQGDFSIQNVHELQAVALQLRKRLVINTLRKLGQIAAAAEVLGVSRKTLSDDMIKIGIDRNGKSKDLLNGELELFNPNVLDAEIERHNVTNFSGLEKWVDEFRKQLIIRVLRRTGHVGKCADTLGVSRRTLSSDISRYGLDPKRLRDEFTSDSHR